MYRSRPPPRGGYPPSFEGRGPPPGRPHPPPLLREDRGRPPFHHGYHDHGPPDPYRRSSPRRRYPSPGSGSHRGGEYWGSGPPPRDRSPSPRGGLPLDHKLVITVGNELTGPPGPGGTRNTFPPHHRDYPPKSGRDGPDDRGSRRRSPSRGRSRPRSRSHSRDRSRAKSRGRSKSRHRSHSRSHSPDRSRAKSRGRSKSRAHSRSPSPDRSRAKSRGRSKSRANSRSRSRSKSRSRSRSRSRSYGRTRSKGRGKSRSRSVSTSSTSSSQSSDGDKKGTKTEFQELELARRRKEMEEILSRPTKSILKKRLDSEDSPSVMSSDSPRGVESVNMSRVAERFLTAMKGMEPHMLASMLAELREDPQMAQRAGLDAELTGILNLLGGTDSKPEEKGKDDIDDEEKFLYGDEDEPRPQVPAEPTHQHSLSDLYRDVTEEALYGDYPQPHAAMAQTYSVLPVASPHLLAHPGVGDHTPRGSHLQQQVDLRYQSRSTITPDQNIKVEVPNPAYPPGTEPLDEKERQEVEEYEKIQDLLKTIGLDLGVTDISKMAARTKERLQGNKPPPKTPTHRPERRSRQGSSYSSDDSGRGGRQQRRSRSRSRSSDSSSSRSRSRAGSWSSDEGQRIRKKSPPSDRHSTHGKSRSVKEVKKDNSDWEVPTLEKTAPQPTPDPKTIAPHPVLPAPPFGQSQPHGMVPPNFPPPGYGQYGNYMPYMPPQQWPPMYPPPGMGMPPQASHDYPKASPYDQTYHKAVQQDSAMKGSLKSAPLDSGKESSKANSREKRDSEEKNNDSQKQKVLEEREKLRQERDIRMKKKEYLMKELERLRKQQGELLRKKRREKDGHKDPLLSEISRLQEEVMSQISDLRKDHEVAETKRKEIEKVALVLGLSSSDRPRKVSKTSEDKEEHQQQKKRERDRSAGTQSPEHSSSTNATAKVVPMNPMSARASSSRASPDKLKSVVPAVAPPPAPPPDPFEYYDAGNHWCKNCNVTSGSMFDFFTHLHSKSHRKTQDPYDRPWAATSSKTKNSSSEEKLTKPAKGAEFLLPVRGFFCLLCREFYGDAICAEEHVTTHAHNEKYKKQMYENPLYEQRRNLDRQAGLALESSGKKRKHDDDDGKEKEEKPKHKKEKKDREKKKEEEEDEEEEKEEKSKPKKEEEEKPKQTKREEEKSVYSKKDVDEKYKYSKKEDAEKYRYSKEEEERAKYSRREEDDRYKYSREEEYRYRYHKEEEDDRFRYSRNEDRPKYGWKDDDDKYRYGRSKYDRKEEERYKPEKDEGKFRIEKEGKQFRKPEHFKEEEKLVPKKQPGPPPKPYDPPKVLCGPSPAMRAKLRKQSIETGKAAPTETARAPPSTFGKFTWRKKESVLAKEAERVAAEFLKDDEAAAAQESIPPEDSFAKSIAVAKEIALKLSDPSSLPPPWVSQGSIRGRIRPNLPAPATILRKTTGTFAKPAPLNTFLSIRPQNAGVLGPPPLVNPAIVTVTPELTKDSAVSSDLISNVFVSQEIPLKGVSEERKKAPMESMMTVESDVDVPGVPASEQNRAVFVKPPPFMNAGDGAQKSDKPKSNLAAAKAQDLFDIFYSSIGQPAPTTVTKPAADIKAVGSDTKKRVNPAPQTSEPQPAPQTKPQAKSLPAPTGQTQHKPIPQSKPTQPQPLPQPQTQPAPKVESALSPSAPQTKPPQPQPDVLIKPIQPQLAPQTEPTQLKPISQAQPQPESVPKSEAVQSQPAPHAQPAPQKQTEPLPDHKPESAQSKPQPLPAPQSQTKSQPAPETQSQSAPETQPQPTPETQPQPAPETQPQPTPESQPHPAPETQPQPAPETQPQPAPETQPQPAPETQPQPTPETQLQPTPEIQPQPTPETQPRPTPETQPRPTPETQPQPTPETQPQPTPETQPQSSSQTEQSPLQTTPPAQPEPQLSPKNKNKISPQSKKTLPPSRPVRQTRSQTRYRTRQQQQSQDESEPQPDPISENEEGTQHTKVPEIEHGAESQPKEVKSEDAPTNVDKNDEREKVTPETLGLPPDMMSLGFEYDFNFE